MRRFISVTSVKNLGLMIQSNREQRNEPCSVLQVKQQLFRIRACPFDQ
jgi:hypothetical protein